MSSFWVKAYDATHSVRMRKYYHPVNQGKCVSSEERERLRESTLANKELVKNRKK